MDVLDANRIKGELKKRGIEAFTKDGGPDDYVELNGISVYGKGIYVEAEDVEQAKEFLKEIEAEEDSTSAGSGKKTGADNKAGAANRRSEGTDNRDSASKTGSSKGRSKSSADDDDDDYIIVGSGKGKVIAGVIIALIVIAAVVAILLMPK